MYRKRITAYIICVLFILSAFNVYGANPISSVLQSAADSLSDTLGQPAEVGQLEETFDIDSGFYNEKLGEGYEFLSSIPNGAVVSDAVYFDVPMGFMNAELEYEGKKIDFRNKTLIYDKGYYILKLSAPTASGEPLVGVFTFRISGAPMNRIPSAIYKYPVVSCTAAISDYGNGMYRYLMPNYKAFLTNISGYGENVENAKFVIPRNMGYSLIRNGQKISLVNNQVYSAPGNYNLRVYGSSYAVGNGYETYYETVLNFSIGSEETRENGSSSASSGSTLGSGTSGGVGSGVSSSAGSSLSSIGGSISSAASSVGSAASSLSSAAGTARSSISSAGSSISSGIGTVSNSISSGLGSISDRLGLGSSANEELINDSLAETYFESAKLYSETFSSGDAFYTNTPEDGIVGGNVYIDIPYNMTVSMTKDGLPVSFENKTYINEEGSYSLLVTDVDGDDVKTARYTFRIQAGVDRSPAIDGAFQFSDYDGTQTVDTNDSSIPQVDEEDVQFDSSVKYDVENSYDQDMGMYSFKAGNTEFFVSVPDGMVSNYDVLINMSAGADAKLVKDGEEIDFISSPSDDGHYELTVTDRASGEETTVSFDIISYSTNAMDRFIAPEGYYISVAQYDDYYGIYTDTDAKDYTKAMDVINHQIATPSNVFEMPLDGEYDFILQGKRNMPVLSATVILDRVAPVVEFEGLGRNMKTDAQSILISCSDPEAVLTLTDSEGKENNISLAGGSASIEGIGKYTLTAEDMAGNVNQYEFTLGDTGGSLGKILITAVLMIILILLAVLVVLIRKDIININNMPFGRKNNDDEKSLSQAASSADDDWEETGGDDWENTGDDDWESTTDDDWENTGDDD